MNKFTLLEAPCGTTHNASGIIEHKWIPKFISNRLDWEEFLGSKTKIKVNPSPESATELATEMHFWAPVGVRLSFGWRRKSLQCRC